MRALSQLFKTSLTIRRGFPRYGSSSPKILWFDYVDKQKDDLKTADGLVNHLMNNIIFENEHIIAFNKPSNVHPYTPKLAVKEGYILNESISIEKILFSVAEKCNCQSLFFCHTPHIYCSGVMMFAKSQKMQNNVGQMFKMVKSRNESAKTDLAVTVGVPSPPSGCITDHIVQEEIGGIKTLVPLFNPSSSKLRTLRKYRTYYEVIDSNNDIALVKLQPKGNLSLQAVVHMTCKLCPILGDQTYSHRIFSLSGVKMMKDPESIVPRPQSLPPYVTKRLNLHSNDLIMKLPLHLHRHKISFPANPKIGFPDRLDIVAPLPQHFLLTLQLLNLKMCDDKL